MWISRPESNEVTGVVDAAGVAGEPGFPSATLQIGDD